MKGLKHAFLAALSLGTFAFASRAVADDAYDDEEEVRRPEAESFDDDGEDESADDGLETGGLKAPDALGETGDQRTEIEKELEESDQKDSGRGLEFVWLSADVGFRAVGLTTFSDGGLVGDGGAASASGLSLGGAAGLRLIYFTLGARFSYGDFATFKPWSLLGEAALRIPLGKLEPYGLVGVGYTGIGGLSGAEGTGGLDLRLGGGIDYYLSDTFSVGAQASGDLLFLSGSLGTAMGGSASGLFLLGLHFG